MDVNLESKEYEIFAHNIEDVKQYVEIVEMVSQSFIYEVKGKLEKEVTRNFEPQLSIDKGTLIWKEF